MTRTAGMLRAYIEQKGFFAGIAKQLGLDPSYISRVAHGQSHSPRISSAIEAVLNKMRLGRLSGLPATHWQSLDPKDRRVSHAKLVGNLGRNFRFWTSSFADIPGQRGRSCYALGSGGQILSALFGPFGA